VTFTGETRAERHIVAAQVGRAPRKPWRVAARCRYGYPSVIASPSVLADGTLFPTFAWLTCPWLVEAVSAEESAGEVGAWARRAADDSELAAALWATDAALRETRATEGDGVDACAETGIAGQRDPLKVKCLHAHVALALAGVDDPIGEAVLGKIGTACADERCSALAANPVGEGR